MYTRAFVKNLILPSISVGVVRAEGKEDECDSTRKLVRPRDLPLYVDPPKCVTCSNTVESEDGFLLTTIRCARQELQSVLEQARVIQAEASLMLDNIKKETSDAVSYLQQEENLLPRMGAIGFGAFAGYILAVRKGILKKMLYSAAGAGAIAAVAYPNEAREYSEEVLCELKKYAVIGYHFVNGAEVDWKKLNEEYRCFEKNGITGGWIEAGPRRKPGEVNRESPADQKSPEKPVQVKPGGDTKTPITKPENTPEVGKTGDESDGSMAKAPSPQTGPGNKADVQMSNGEPCPTPPETPLPQDRPQKAIEPRTYKSYSDECKAKSACVKKQRSDSSTLFEKSTTSEPNSNGSGMQSSNSSENPNPSPDSYQSQIEPQNRRLETSDARQSNMKSTGPPPGSNDSGACILPDGNVQRPRSSESGVAKIEPKGRGSNAQRPRTAGPDGGTPSRANSNSLPQPWPSPPPYRPREVPEISSGSQQRPQSSEQGACQMRPSSNNGTTGSRYQELPQSQPAYGLRQPAPQSRNSLPNSRKSTDEGSCQSFRTDCNDGCCMKRSKPKCVKAESPVSSES